ncbi:MAG TPA: HAD hydrolase family protein [Candidatus Deferrimicrobium sp.]|nr:HAD hydrolase family protein [Candidatus Deferrimicrobium sp.]
MPKLTREEFIVRLKQIKLLALDVDGVLTDDCIYFGPDGFEVKRFSISDGLYMRLAMRAGLQLAVVSGRYSVATESRMRDLGVPHVLQDMKDKVMQIEPLLEKLRIKYEDIAFIGNEILDLTLAQRVALPIAVADSVPELLQIALFVTQNKGGHGAVREVLELYFEAVGKDPKTFLL